MRFLLFRVYESGTCNMWMSIEIAIGLSVLTGRTLVLYGTKGVENHIWHARGGRFKYKRPGFQESICNDKHPSIFDLLEKPQVKTIDYADFINEYNINDSSNVHITNDQIAGCIFVKTADLDGLNSAAESLNLESFRAGRKIITEPDKKIWHISGATLSYYSRFFFNPSVELHQELEKIRPAKYLEELAKKIAGSLGAFNGIHIRLTDFKKFRPQKDSYSSDILFILKEIFSTHKSLAIGTDESENNNFFESIRKNYSNSIFLDHWILENFSSEFKDLPFRDEQTLGFLTNIVLWHSSDFIGTLGSTFTGFIHRNWSKNLGSTFTGFIHRNWSKNQRILSLNQDATLLPWRFTSHTYNSDSINIDGKFENGVFIDCKDGYYSWNRIDIPANFGAPSWVREWPEALMTTKYSYD